MPYIKASEDWAAVLGASIFCAAIANMVCDGLGWPDWLPWLIPIAGLCWSIERRVRAFNELAHQWNTKIEHEEAAAVKE
ncbi:hypothetical protein [Streptomyces sp. NPDC058751]|uniref:hypothetical protein n=1 Tax=Streptomyces sp. NPDC058751 TaxID=3346623 RepID=UPI00368C19B6